MVINSIGLGGVTEVAYQLIRHLPHDRFDLKLFALKLDDALDHHRCLRLDKLRQLGIDVAGAHPSHNKTETIAGLSRWIQSEPIDILHTHSYRPNVLGRLAGLISQGRGLRMIAHYHNDYSNKWRKHWASLRLERDLAATTDAFVVVSETVGNHVATRLDLEHAKLNVLRNGIEHDFEMVPQCKRGSLRQRLKCGASKPLVDVVGRVCHQKGQDVVVEALIEMASSQDPPHVVFVGELEDEALHARMMDRLGANGVDTDVTFLGHVDDMVAVYADLDLLLVPSRWEGFGLMLGEAMASGVPILATRLDVVEEIVGTSGAAMLVPRKALMSWRRPWQPFCATPFCVQECLQLESIAPRSFPGRQPRPN